MSTEPTLETATMASNHSLWSDLRDAVRGTGADYTKIPLRRAVFLLAVPMVLELVLESTFAVVDIFFVAKLGPSAVAKQPMGVWVGWWLPSEAGTSPSTARAAKFFTGVFPHIPWSCPAVFRANLSKTDHPALLSTARSS